MLKKVVGLSVLASCVAAANVQAAQADIAAQLKLLDVMVQEGAIAPDKAARIRAKLLAGPKALPAEEAGVTRVEHVPEHIRNQIRDEVRIGVREDVVKDVMTQAKNEHWGLPGALPEWVNRIKLKGDLRLRSENIAYGSDNIPNTYYNYARINEKKEFVDQDNELFQNSTDSYLNVTDDRFRLRARARLAMESKVTDLTKASVRLATGSAKNPVSTNQSFGNENNPWSIYVDRAYVTFTDLDLDRYPWLVANVGRINNPFLTTDLLWDNDLAFEGASFTYKYNWVKEGLYFTDDDSRTLFANAGIFAVDESELTAQDKWLFAMQVGGEFIADDQSKLTLALGYYDYQNIEGVLNEKDRDAQDYTAPGSPQKGNTLFNIVNYTSPYELDPQNNAPPNDALMALAADFNIVDLTMVYDLARFAPLHVIMTAHMLENIGYDKNDVQARLNSQYIPLPQPINAGLGDDIVPPEYDNADPKTKGYYFNVDLGWPMIAKRGDWSVGIGYKYLEADAVVDAYTDSDFHLGGTDAKGFILSGRYGLAPETYLQLRYMAASEIDAVNPLNIDVMQLDLNVKL
ncbi:MAG TPA: putative porin [Pseudomonadales bacterium]|nr:putative porin [Pseudomonadales bacterium]